MSFLADTACVCQVRPAINHEPRVGGRAPDMLILHYTGMENHEAALDWLCGADSGVSCHYFVFEDGRIVQMVPEHRRAWHAGKSFWRGETDINSRSIGIEIANRGHEFGYTAFPDMQIAAVIELCRDISLRNGILSRDILAHSDVAPDRKIDPGELFPWQKLHDAGVGHFATPVPVAGGRLFQKGDSGEPVLALQSMLALYGYAIEISGKYCDQTEQAVTAFQRHFRPQKVDGIADESTFATLRKLLDGLEALA